MSFVKFCSCVFISVLFNYPTIIKTQNTTDFFSQVDLVSNFVNTSSNVFTGNEKLSIMEWLSQLFGRPTTEPPEELHEPESCPSCQCGLTYKKIRIIGGQETQVNQYPWMALLMYGGRFYCGATVISNLHVLTAAHCVHGFRKERITVRLLEHDRKSNNETKTITRKVKRIIRHESYSTANYDSDIAILKLAEQLPFDDLLRPVCLPPLGRSFTGMEGIVTGWGATEQHGEVSQVLNEVMVPIMSNEECRKTSYGAKRITDNMMCAGYVEGGKDSCQGDSGGPLHVNNGSVHCLAGIVSWGEGCAQKNYPGVYTRVNRYITWIKTNTIDGCFCDEGEMNESE